MTVHDYYKQFNVIHSKTNCRVCNNTTDFEPITGRIRFWLVLDISLILISLILGYMAVIYIIQSTTTR